MHVRTVHYHVIFVERFVFNRYIEIVSSLVGTFQKALFFTHLLAVTFLRTCSCQLFLYQKVFYRQAMSKFRHFGQYIKI